MKIILFGPQGVGKGTMGTMVSEKYNIPLLSMGQILRDSVKEGTEIGKMAEEHMNKGELVPDEVTASLMKERVQKEDCTNGYILDGFPRTINQAKLFDEEMNNIDYMIVLEAPDELLLKRLTGRLTCKNCGAIFNKYPECNPNPKVEGVCDKCGGELGARADDNEEAIKKRLQTYHEETKPIIEKYKTIGVDSSDNPPAIMERIVKVL